MNKIRGLIGRVAESPALLLQKHGQSLNAERLAVRD